MIRRLLTLGAVLAAACSPALDWREVRPPGSDASALFPCKPSREVRRVRLAGEDVEMALHVCRAGGATWALAHADVASPAAVPATLEALAAALPHNLGAASAASTPTTVPGMTPNLHALRLRAQGARPDGSAVTAESSVFAKGTRVFQATIIAPAPDPAAADTFFSSFGLP
jgi:hypothetical protein